MGILTEEAIEFLTEKFNEADKDKSGSVNHEELHAVMTKIAEREGFEKPTKEDVDARIAAIDQSGDGKIDLQEFLDFVAFMKVMMIIEVIFAETDKDGSGAIDSKELKSLLVKISENDACACCAKMDPPTDAQVAEYMKALDVSGDGKIEFKEFAYFMVPIIIAASMEE